jgi:hypothetical protein
MSFATLFKPSAQSVLAVAKNIDANLEKFCSLLASELKLDSSVNVKDAFVKCMHVFENDEKKMKEEKEKEEKEAKRLKREADKAERDAKKKQEEEEKKAKREQDKLEREAKKKEKEEMEKLEKERKKAEKEADKAKKAEEKKQAEEKKKEKVEIKCDDCAKVIRKGKEIDDKTVCGECFKKIEKEIKEKNKVVCSHTGKDGKKCSITASENGMCKRHAKKVATGAEKTSSSSDSESKKVMFEELETTINDFDYEEEPIVDFDQEHEFWSGKKCKIDGVKCILTKTGIIYTKEDNIFIGIRVGDEIKKEDELCKEVLDWLNDSGLVVKSMKKIIDELDLE